MRRFPAHGGDQWRTVARSGAAMSGSARFRCFRSAVEAVLSRLSESRLCWSVLAGLCVQTVFSPTAESRK